MDLFDIPIFQKTYALYRIAYKIRLKVPKQDRYALWQRCENLIIDVLEGILFASHLPKREKLPVLETVSRNVNTLRVFIRLAKDIKAIENKKYVGLETMVDEIGRMLGGWIKSVKSE